MQKMKVVKSVTFDTAHRLSHHSGKCTNLHGHTYKLDVGVEFFASQALSRPSGMYIDFSDLKKAIKAVEELMDHATILNIDDAKYLGVIAKSQEKFITFQQDPTAEVMAVWIKDFIYKRLEKEYPEITNIFVRLWETPTSYVEV